MCGPRHRSIQSPCLYSVMVSAAGRSRISSALYASPRGAEEAHRLLAVPDLALERGVAGHDLPHPRLDGGEVLRGERLVAREVVVEAVLDGGADGDLRPGIQALHRLCQHVRGVVADHAERLRVAPGHEHDGGVLPDHAGQVGELAVHLHGERRAGQAGANGGGGLGARHRRVEAANRAVGQGDGGHGVGLSQTVLDVSYGLRPAPPQPRPARVRPAVRNKRPRWRPASRRSCNAPGHWPAPARPSPGGHRAASPAQRPAPPPARPRRPAAPAIP